MRLLYFAWVKEKVGRASEDIALPPEIATIAELIAWLKTRGPEFANAFDSCEIGHVYDQRVEAWPSLGFVNASDRFRIGGVGGKAVNRLRRDRDRKAVADQACSGVDGLVAERKYAGGLGHRAAAIDAASQQPRMRE
jgi:molybdopterin synthase sulfur carrier subunit